MRSFFYATLIFLYTLNTVKKDKKKGSSKAFMHFSDYIC